MVNCTRWLKVGYLLAFSTVVVLLLSKPEPAQAQRSIAYPFLPGATVNMAGMAAVAANSSPQASFTQAQTMLMQAGSPLDPFGVGQSGGMGLFGQQGMGGGNAGGGFGGGGGMRGGGMGGMGGMAGMGGMGGMAGMGGMMGMGGLPMGGGLGGGLGGVGGLGGFAGKGFGGFNGKKPL